MGNFFYLKLFRRKWCENEALSRMMIISPAEATISLEKSSKLAKLAAIMIAFWVSS